MAEFRKNRRQTEGTNDQQGLPELEIGDKVRYRVAPDKLEISHKSHLAFKADQYDQTISWSRRTFIVQQRKHLRTIGKYRYLLNNAWYDRYELQKIPHASDRIIIPQRAVRQRTPSPPRARRSGRLREKKKVNYGKYF